MTNYWWNYHIETKFFDLSLDALLIESFSTDGVLSSSLLSTTASSMQLSPLLQIRWNFSYWSFLFDDFSTYANSCNCASLWLLLAPISVLSVSWHVLDCWHFCFDRTLLLPESTHRHLFLPSKVIESQNLILRQ